MDYLARVKTKIEGSSARLAAIGGRIRINLREAPSLFVDSRSVPPLVDGFDGEGDVTITAEVSDLAHIFDGERDTVLSMIQGKLKFSGNALIGRQFVAAVKNEIYKSAPPIDYTDLPVPTRDLSRAHDDLVRYGYCLIEEVLPPEEVKLLRSEMEAAAEEERAGGYATLEGGPKGMFATEGPNQRLFYLINKHEAFRNLLLHPILDKMIEPILGQHFISFGFCGIVAGPGGGPMLMHYDQLFVQPPISYPVLINVGWFLDDVTKENGGTRLLPGSHLWDTGPADPSSMDGTVAAAGPAGTVLLFDSRLWHGTGPNVSNTKRHILFTAMARPYIRAQDNFFLLLDPEIEAGLSDALKARLGYRVTNALGAVGQPIDGRIVGRDDRDPRRRAEGLERRRCL